MTIGSSMLMAICYVFFCYILFSSFHASKPFAYGARVVEKNKSGHAPPSTGSGPARGLPVVHRYGSSEKKSSASLSQILLLDERRVQFINSRSYKYNSPNGVWKGERESLRSPFDLNELIGAGNYFVTVGFGTPVKDFNLILDTGSYITWVNCQLCLSWFPCQQEQNNMYNPSSSSTSSNAPCLHSSSSCQYNQSYQDNSFAGGIFMLDTITIPLSDLIRNFAFLCGLQHGGDFGEAHGILGLALSQGNDVVNPFGYYSLISQTDTKFGKVFCHCLPTKDDSQGYVYFGEEAHEKCQSSGTRYTPLLSNPSDPKYYYVNLIAITIGQKRLEISSSASSSPPSTILDSGTVISRLPSEVYSELKLEFQKSMLSYPPAAPDKIQDTCYNLQGFDNIEIPHLVLHFENLDVNLDQTAVTSKGKDDDSQVCLAFAGNRKPDDLTIIGNHQLQKLNVVYNIPEQRVEIGPGNC